MKKSDLRNGDIVQLRVGSLYYVVGTALVNNHTHVYFGDIGEDLLCRSSSEFDVVKVYKQEKPNDLKHMIKLCVFTRDNLYKWTWER